MKRNTRALHSLLWLLALALVTWTLRQLALVDMLSWPGRLDTGQWLLWSVTNMVILYLAVQRWQLLAYASNASLSLSQLFRLRQSGSTVSFITPGPQFGGEPLQLYWLHRYFNLPLHRAINVLGLDRFLETGTNIAVLLAGVLMLLGTAIMPMEAWLQVTAILASVLLAMLIAAALILRHPEFLARCFRSLVKRWPIIALNGRPEKGGAALVDLLRTTLTQQRPRLYLALLLALLGWVLILFELVLLLGFLGLSPSASEVILIMVGMRLAMLLPMPGGIGTVEASLLWSFGFLGLPLSATAGLITLIRLRDAVILLLGLVCLAGFRRPPAGMQPQYGTSGNL